MRLLFINYEFPPLGGGGGRANAHIARHMAALGHEVKVITSSFRDLPRRENKDGYEIIRIPTLRKYPDKCRIYEMAVFLLSSLFYAVKLVRHWRPDRTIAFFTIPSAPAAWLLKHLYNIDYLVSLRGGDVPGFMQEQLSFYHGLLRPITRRLWRQSRAVVANSEGLKKLALKTAGAIPVDVIPNGVDIQLFCQPAGFVPTETIAGPKTLRLLTVGRLSSQKGFSYLLEALAILQKKIHQPFELRIIGDGPLRSELEAQSARLGLGQQVLFSGWKDQAELVPFYAAADIFVLPSLYEGMPNVVLEAMAMGLPIVGTDIEGTREIVVEGKNGWIVPARDEKALAAALLKLLEQKDLRLKMSQTSLELSRNYNWHQVALDYLRLC